MIGPMTLEVCVMAAANPREKPARSIAGMRTEPTAAVSATAEPEMPEKKIEETTFTWPRPPRI